jgi:hypothetical protein
VPEQKVKVPEQKVKVPEQKVKVPELVEGTQPFNPSLHLYPEITQTVSSNEAYIPFPGNNCLMFGLRDR